MATYHSVQFLDVAAGEHAAIFCGNFSGDGQNDCYIGQSDSSAGSITLYLNTGADYNPGFSREDGSSSVFTSDGSSALTFVAPWYGRGSAWDASAFVCISAVGVLVELAVLISFGMASQVR